MQNSKSALYLRSTGLGPTPPLLQKSGPRSEKGLGWIAVLALTSGGDGWRHKRAKAPNPTNGRALGQSAGLLHLYCPRTGSTDTGALLRIQEPVGPARQRGQPAKICLFSIEYRPRELPGSISVDRTASASFMSHSASAAGKKRSDHHAYQFPSPVCRGPEIRNQLAK